MKILLAISFRGRNIAFITDTLEKISLKKALVYLEKGRLEGVHWVQSKIYGRRFLRSNPNSTEGDNLDKLAISMTAFNKAKDDLEIIFQEPSFKKYYQLHQAYLSTLQKRGDIIMVIDNHMWVPQQWVVDEVLQYKKIILSASENFSIDPYLLGAIIIDEYARFNVFDFLGDLPLAHLGRDSSVGISQIKLSTAKDIIKKGYYNPNQSDSKLSTDKINKVSNAYLYKYVIEPKHNIFIAAGRVRQIIDHWSKIKDLTKLPSIIGTLYAKGLGNPKKNPKSTSRGRQIADEFYSLAKKILR